MTDSDVDLRPCPHTIIEYELARDLWCCTRCGKPQVTNQMMPA